MDTIDGPWITFVLDPILGRSNIDERVRKRYSSALLLIADRSRIPNRRGYHQGLCDRLCIERTLSIRHLVPRVFNF